MKYFTFLTLSVLLGVALCRESPKHPIKELQELILKQQGNLVGDDGKISMQVCNYKDCPYPIDGCKYISYWHYRGPRNHDKVEVHYTRPETLVRLPKKKDWKFLYHGYGGSRKDTPSAQLRQSYYKKGYELMMIDYAPLVKLGCYHTAIKLIPLIAKCNAEFIDRLIDERIVGSNKLHLIGFDLGAEIAGNVYYYLRHKKPKRVTGLSPPTSYFDKNKHYLNSESGRFVDVIHGGGYFNGSLSPLGDADFFPNGGFAQRGCDDSDQHGPFPCSSIRVVQYYAESIESDQGFWGIPCTSLEDFYYGLCKTTPDKMVIMGDKTSQYSRGTYYLQTRTSSPFALGKQNVSVELFGEEPLL